VAGRAEPEYRSVARSIFGGVPGGEPYALVTSCSDDVAFLKSSETDLTIEHVLIAIGVESEYKSIARSLFGRGPNGEPDAPIAAESAIVDLLRQLKLTQRPDSSM
jgi:hypothetical protein